VFTVVRYLLIKGGLASAKIAIGRSLLSITLEAGQKNDDDTVTASRQSYCYMIEPADKATDAHVRYT